MTRSLLILALVTVFVWFCAYRGYDWGPFRSLIECQDYNGEQFHYQGFCHFEF